MTIARPATTAIGSLPHHNIDAALQFSFQLSIPFLPQIPIRNSWEYMIPQALEGLPGLEVDSSGMPKVDIDVWAGRSKAFNEKLDHAFKQIQTPSAFESFEPSAPTSSSWQPFLWELAEKRVTSAKLQIAGPLTCQWALNASPELSHQIFRLVLARSLAMTRRVRQEGVDPIFFIDEPGLFGLDASNARHALGIQELKLFVQTLRKEGTTVGLHCCSNTSWASVLNLGLDYLSIDTHLSLDGLLSEREAFLRFADAGGRLALGVIPTPKAPGELATRTSAELFTETLATFGKHLPDRPELAKKLMLEAIYTPACGLALHSTADAETVLSLLKSFESYCRNALS